MYRIFIVILIASIVLSCSKNESNYDIKEVEGVRHYYNKNIPAKPNLKFESESIFKINSGSNSQNEFSNILHFTCNASGNIFIIDKDSKISQYDSQNNFINSFGRKGKGPGEIENPTDIVVLGDTILVPDETRKVVKFDLEGKYIGDFYLTQGTPKIIFPIGKEKFLCAKDNYIETDDGYDWILTTSINTSKFEQLKIIDEQKVKWLPKNISLLDFIPIYAVGAKDIYFAEQSKTNYTVQVFDSEGIEKYIIHKSYMKTSLTEKEISLLNTIHKKYGLGLITEDSKNSITKIFEDKYGFLWVFSRTNDEEEENKLFVDLFKDGIFQNRVHIDLIDNYQYSDCNRYWLFFANHLIYLYDNEDKTVEVFNYKISES
ncbi:MAG: hypothetical protein JW870_19095 [Candidatus Delongbacteria bacterium]|nr:hypothetical protein [Candidatus Delongbacteria bacterium]